MKDFSLLLRLLDERRYQALHDELKEENPADIASFFETLPNEKAAVVFRLLPKDLAAEVFAELFADTRQSLVRLLSDREVSQIIEELYLDDAVDFIEELPAGVAKKVLACANEDTRDKINFLLKYPENSAGSIMTVESVDFPRNITVLEAFERIRRVGIDKETIYTCYVTDTSRRLEGVVTVRRMLLSEPDALISDIMDKNLILARTSDDREAVAHQFDKYDLLSIPVVDSEDRLVGIITIDDIVDVVQEEATEDFEKMAAMIPSEKPYLRTSVFSLAWNRIWWLLVLMASGMLTGGILTNFESAVAAVPALFTFIPMLTDTGGNAGSQSSTMIIRGMALREVKTSDALKVVWKELRVSLLLGAVLSAVNVLRVLWQYGGNPDRVMLSVTISFSLLVTVVLAQTLGGALPIAAKVFRVDPAVMAAPLITTVVDAFSLIIFFSVARALLKI